MTISRVKASGLKPEHWSNASLIRTIFREAFKATDLPYFNPHSFRKTLVTLGQQLCQTPEEFKSWSQNLGHEDVLTSLYSYGEVQQHSQGDGKPTIATAEHLAARLNFFVPMFSLAKNR